jgi:hypothetical protein
MDAPVYDHFRARLYRLLLGAAALYNLGFGLWAVLWPRSFFDLFEMAPPRYPAVWQCLGMVIALYGLAYGYAATRLERARPFVAIGLLGKVLGPIGWVVTVSSGEWPLRTFTLIVFNDLAWWLPFSLLLLEGTRLGERVRASAPYACAALNALAAGALLLVLRNGTEVQASLAERAAYVAQNPVLWRAGWGLWMAAALSLLGFYAWWGARLPASGWGIAAVAIAAAGLACDLLADSLYIGWWPDHLGELHQLGSLLSGGAANGLYTLGGILLTLAPQFSSRIPMETAGLGTPALKGRLRVWAWVIWASGLGLSASTLTGSVAGMVVSGGLLMALFCPWAAVIGWKLR